MVLRSDTEVEGSEKLTGRDKAVLGFIWISSFVYALLNDQVLHHQHPTITTIKGETKISSLVHALLIPHICHFFYTGKTFGELNLHRETG